MKRAQSMPVAASTISLLMLSLDRYATVKHSRLSQLRERRYLPRVLAVASWCGAIILCTPHLLFYQTETTAATVASATASSSTVSFCLPDYGSARVHVWFICMYTLLVFVVPGLGVLLNHLGVRKKLCALSLTARAAHGELPLPMPILRRPTHMIIVTGMANNGRGGGGGNGCGPDSSDDEAAPTMGGGGAAGTTGTGGSTTENYGQERNCTVSSSKKIRCNPRTPRYVFSNVCELFIFSRKCELFEILLHALHNIIA